MLPFATSRTHLLKSVCYHIPHPPALVLEQTPQRSQENTMARLLLLGYRFGDRDEDVDSQESDTVLVVCGEVLEEGNHLFDDNGRRHGLDELGEVVCRLSPYHGGIIVH